MLRKICSLLSTLLIVLLLLPVGVLTAPRLAGYMPYTVLSGSMEPSYPVGSVVFIRPAAPQTIAANDVIMFTLENGTRVTHRVVSVLADKQAFVTKGDANNTNDFSPVPFNRLVGRAQFCLPLMGYLAAYLNSGYGIAALIAIFTLTVLLWLIPKLFKKADNTAGPSKALSETDTPL